MGTRGEREPRSSSHRRRPQTYAEWQAEQMKRPGFRKLYRQVARERQGQQPDVRPLGRIEDLRKGQQ